MAGLRRLIIAAGAAPDKRIVGAKWAAGGLAAEKAYTDRWTNGQEFRRAMTSNDRGTSKPLRVGVIGLGSRWQKRYQPAFAALRKLYEVRVLCDPMQQHALREARRLGCDAVAGMTVLLESDDVEAVFVLDERWFGLWPVEQACRFGKPVLCATSLEHDDAGADALLARVRERQLPVIAELRPRLAPAVARLREMLSGELGPPRLVICESRDADEPSAAGPAAPLLGPDGIGLVDACLSLFGDEPVGVRAERLTDADYGSLLLDFGGGRAAHVCHYRAAGLRPGVRLQVVTEKSGAQAQLPGRLEWADAAGRHQLALGGRRSLTQLLLERFYEAVRSGQAPSPSLDDAHRALRVLRAARGSAEDSTAQAG